MSKRSIGVRSGLLWILALATVSVPFSALASLSKEDRESLKNEIREIEVSIRNEKERVSEQRQLLVMLRTGSVELDLHREYSPDRCGACDTACQPLLQELNISNGGYAEDSSCFQLFQTPAELTRGKMTAACRSAVSRCGLVRRVRDVARVEREVRAADARIKELNEEKKELQKKSKEERDAKVDCSQCALIHAQSQGVDAGFHIVNGLSVIAPVVSNGIQAQFQLDAQNAQRRMYEQALMQQNQGYLAYLQQCATIGVPCEAPSANVWANIHPYSSYNAYYPSSQFTLNPYTYMNSPYANWNMNPSAQLTMNPYAYMNSPYANWSVNPSAQLTMNPYAYMNSPYASWNMNPQSFAEGCFPTSSGWQNSINMNSPWSAQMLQYQQQNQMQQYQQYQQYAQYQQQQYQAWMQQRMRVAQQQQQAERDLMIAQQQMWEARMRWQQAAASTGMYSSHNYNTYAPAYAYSPGYAAWASGSAFPGVMPSGNMGLGLNLSFNLGAGLGAGLGSGFGM